MNSGTKAAIAAGRNSRSMDQITRMMWLEDAWNGWIKPGLGVVTIAAIAGLYYIGYLGEWSVGLLFGGTMAVTPLTLAVLHATGLARSPRQMMAMWMAGGAVALVALAAVVGACFPGQVLYQGQLSAVQREVALNSDATSIEVSVNGHLDQLGKAPYDLALVTPSGTEHLKGEVVKESTTARMGKRRVSGVIHEEGERRFVQYLTSAPTALKLETADASINHLNVEVRSTWLPLIPLMALGGLAVLALIVIDGRMATKTRHTYLSMASVFTLIFGYVFFTDATHGQMVRNAFGAMLMAGVTGAIGGVLLSSLSSRLFGVRPGRSTAAAKAG